jgi:hypothetical protein
LAQENITPTPLGELAETTISSEDEEAAAYWMTMDKRAM